MQLEETLDWYIAPAAPHGARASSRSTASAARTKQYQVALDPQRLQASGISVAQVVDALEQANANAGGGYIEHGREHFVIGTTAS